MAIEARDYAARKTLDEVNFKFEGLFDFDGLYLMMQKWLTRKRYEFHEKQYKHKPKELGKEVELKWFAEKKITGYYMSRLDISFHLWDINEVEIKGKIWTQARMQILIKGTLILDYEEKWGKNALFKSLRDFFHEYVVKKQIDHVWGENIRLEILELLEDTKKYLSSYATGRSY